MLYYCICYYCRVLKEIKELEGSKDELDIKDLGLKMQCKKHLFEQIKNYRVLSQQIFEDLFSGTYIIDEDETFMYDIFSENLELENAEIAKQKAL